MRGAELADAWSSVDIYFMPTLLLIRTRHGTRRSSFQLIWRSLRRRRYPSNEEKRFASCFVEIIGS